MQLVRLGVLIIAAVITAGCRNAPDIVEVAVTAAPETTAASTTEATPVEPVDSTSLASTLPSTSDTTATTTVPLDAGLDPNRALDVAAAFVEALRSGESSGDLSHAGELWSGYPYSTEERSGHLTNLLAANPWIMSGSLSFQVLDGWAFEPQWAMTVVAILDDDLQGVTTLLLDREGTIQRIGLEAFRDAPVPMSVVNSELVINQLPLEGSANGYLNGVLLPDPVVDHTAITTAFQLPPPTGARQVFVASFATPEFPFVIAEIIDY